MTDLLVPGDERAGSVFSDGSILAALVRVEQAWLDALAAASVAPGTADLLALVGPHDAATIAGQAEAGGNPVIPMVSLLRQRLAAAPAARWLHRGLTSQDVMDSALVLCLRDAVGSVLDDVRRQVRALARLATVCRSDIQAARTLTQHAVPTTFGAVTGGWLHGILDAAEDLTAATRALPVQVGGAAGTLAAPAELAGGAEAARALAADLARRLGLQPSPPWHTRRRPLTRVADALVACTDSWGKVATDVLLRARPEVAELAEQQSTGRGGSSTLPHKHNPVLAVLVQRTALAALTYAAQLHLASASAADERPAGAWHAEWPALRALARSATAAASLTAELIEGLTVDTGRMRATAEAAQEDLLAEQASVRALLGKPADRDLDAYVGAAPLLADEAAERAAAWLDPLEANA